MATTKTRKKNYTSKAPENVILSFACSNDMVNKIKENYIILEYKNGNRQKVTFDKAELKRMLIFFESEKN